MDSYKGLIPAVSIYYENLSGKRSGEFNGHPQGAV
jgi:hypothetical protein